MKWAILAIVAVVIAVVAVLVRRKRPRWGEILPASEMKRKYGLYAENRPVIKINPAEVPEHLRELIPFAEEWGIEDDVIRSDFEEKAGQEKKAQLQAACRSRMTQVTEWLDSYNNTDNPMPQAAAHFMYMQLAFDELGLWKA